MKVLIIDPCYVLLDLCIRAQDDGHEVKWWGPKALNGKVSRIGEGFFEKLTSWEPYAKWADLIICGDNAKYARDIQPLFVKGFPIFGTNAKAAELELDRGLGQKICADYGIKTIPFVIIDSWEDAIKHVEKTMGIFVSKPWGGTTDKALSYVSGSPEDMIFKLRKWSEGGKLQGQIMLQERVDGIEMAVGGWFGRGGWGKHLCENFEEKKFMNDGLGQNTGEQGTILRYEEKSKLFDECLEPVTDYLHKISYVGYVDMNTMVTKKCPASPLEFTMRFGYPLREIQSVLHRGDSVTWMADLLEGRDTLKVSEDIAVGIVLSHGSYPRSRNDDPENDGFPMYGMTAALEDHVHFSEMRFGKAPVNIGGKIKEVAMPVTAGAYLATVTGTGLTVSEAQEAAYKRIWKLKPPTNRMFRTDIGDRLKKELPILQSDGYASNMEF